MKKITFCIFILAFLTSCSGASTPETIASPSVQPAETTQAPTISVTIAPTLSPATKPSATSTVTPTSTSTPQLTNTPVFSSRQVSFVNWGAEVQNLSTDGLLVLGDSSEASIRCYFLDLRTGEINQLNASTSCYSVSPDRLRVSGFDDSEGSSKLVVLNSEGKILSLDEWKDYWFPLQNWINNEYLILLSRVASVNAILYDPRNKTEINVPDQFPNRLDYEPIDVTRRSGAAGVFYSPQTDYAVYQVWDEDVEGWYYSFALYDWKNQREIGRVPLGYPLFPQWSPDGREAVIVAGHDYTGSPSPGELMPDELSFEIFRMSIDGEVEQITTLGMTFQDYKIYDLSWSPDGIQLAFLLEIEEASHPCSEKCIAIVDLSTLKTTIYTMPEGYHVEVSSWVNTIIWSPQGDQLLLPVKNDDHYLIMVFDIAKEVLFEVAKNARIIGWMNAAP